MLMESQARLAGEYEEWRAAGGRFSLIVGERRAGKSYLALHLAAERARIVPNTVVRVVTPYLNDAWRIVLELEHVPGDSAVELRPKRRLTFPNGSIVELVPAQVAAVKQGDADVLVVLFAEQVGARVLAMALPCLSARNGNAIIVAGAPAPDNRWLVEAIASYERFAGVRARVFVLEYPRVHMPAAWAELVAQVRADEATWVDSVAEARADERRDEPERPA